MRELLERIRKGPTFPPAIIAPVLIMLVFSLFNLTAPMDPAKLPAAVTIGVVNRDAGLPLVPLKMSDMMLQGMRANLPFHVAEFDDDAAARAALTEGEVAAVLELPQDFTANVTSGAPITVRILNGQHLSLAETQLSGALPQQLQAAMTGAIATVRLAAAQGRPPSLEPAVRVETETLFPASGPAALASPIVMVFATWLASFVGALMFFAATRPHLTSSTAVPLAVVRSLLPVAVAGPASLVLAIVVASAAHVWGSFFALWGLAWLATTAITLLIAGAFALFDLWAIVVVLPLVFYQSILGGAQAPIAAAPDWLRGLGEALPFSALSRGYRAVVIGGPDGAVPVGLLLVVAAIGVVLIFAGTGLWGMLRRGRVAAPAHG